MEKKHTSEPPRDRTVIDYSIYEEGVEVYYRSGGPAVGRVPDDYFGWAMIFTDSHGDIVDHVPCPTPSNWAFRA